MEQLPTIASVTGYIIGVAGAITIVFSRTKTENLKDLKERVDMLEKDREESRAQHLENQKAIANLEGQLSTYKEIPLKSIATSLEQIAKSNGSILERLDKSAIALSTEKHDGGLLVKTDDTPLDVKEKK